MASAADPAGRSAGSCGGTAEADHAAPPRFRVVFLPEPLEDVEFLLRDLRLSFRGLRRTPGTAVIAAVAFALGIGLTTLVFSILWGVLVRGLPFDQAEELVRLRRTNPARGITSMGVSIHDLADWRAAQRSFEGLAAWYNSTLNLSDDELAPARLNGAYIEPEAFRLLGERPLLGRLFTEAENEVGAAPVMLIGWGAWQQQFGGDPEVVGRQVRVTGETTTIIGVMPRGFAFPSTQNAWLPLRLDAGQSLRGDGRTVAVFGRLRDGVTVDAARTDIERVAQRLAAEYPATNEGVGSRVDPFANDVLSADERVALYAMFGSVIFVLLIACANVTNLLMARAMMRSREVGVRMAMGASRWRVVSPFLAESFALALAGGIVGIGLGWVGIRWFARAISDKGAPFWIDVRFDGAALLWASGAMLAASLLAGALPAAQAALARTSEILKDESRGTSSFKLGRLSRLLVAGEMAMSVGLLVGAGLMIKSVFTLWTIDMGFETPGVYTARVSLPPLKYGAPELRRLFAEEWLERVRALPGIEAASLTTSVPGLGAGSGSFAIEGESYLAARDYPTATFVDVSTGFFESIGVQVLTGRDFSAGDRAGGLPVAIVNRAFERRYFPDGGAPGRRIRPGGAENPGTWITIVGIAPDLFASGVEDDRPEAIYQAVGQTAPGSMSILARTRGDPADLTPAVRGILADMDPDLPLYSAGALDELIRRDNWQYGLVGTLFATFGLAALFLASVGLYGVMAFSVSRRTREIGVRMSLGADSRDVLRLIFLHGLSHTAVGLAVGTAFALAVSNVIGALLFKVEPRDPFIFGGVIVVLLATTVLACWIPAKRAAAVDPLEALRAE